jgi:alpha-amylase
VYTARGLSSGTHTLTIEVTHERAAKTDGSWVWIDGFDIENGAGLPGGVTAGTGRVEENHPALLFTGRWYANANPDHSGGSAVLATDAGSRATINFNGTGVSWIAYRDEWSGIARVYVDGQLRTTIDNDLVPSQTRATPYIITGMPAGTHALTIEVTGTRNASSKGSWVWIDSFDVMP